MKKLLYLIPLLLSLLAPSAWAVTYDVGSVNDKPTTGTTLTQSHTVTSAGGNRAIYVLCALRSLSVTLTATYNSVSMTEVRNDVEGSTAHRTYIFRLLAPDTGAHDWVVTQSGAITMVCNGVSLTNVNQSTPETDHDGLCAASGTSATLTLTDTADDLVLDTVENSVDGSALTQGADQTDEYTPIDFQSGTGTAGASQQLGSADGVMSWSWTGSAGHCHSAVSVAHSLFVSGSGGMRRRNF
jgi:hypothetical protein